MLHEMPIQGLHQHFRLVLLALGHRVQVHVLKHECPHPLHGPFHPLRHQNIVPSHARRHYVVDEMIQPAAGSVPDDFPDLPGHVRLLQNSRPDGIVHVMVNIGDLV